MPNPWRSPFSATGADGWRDSEVALCAGYDEVWGSDLVYESGSVYAMMHGIDRAHLTLGLPDADGGTVSEERGFFTPETTRVLRNDGSGWTLRADLNGMSEVQHMAVLGTSLLLYGGNWQARQSCSLATLSGEQFSCEGVGPVAQLHVTGPTSAVALLDSNALLLFDGTSWQALPNPLVHSPGSLWADGDQIVAGTPSGVARRRLDSDEWTFDVSGPRSLLTALWGPTANDLWAGDTLSHLWHFDGTRWTEVADLGAASTCSTRSAISGVLGVGSDVWVYSATQLARWNGDRLETLGNWSCAVSDSADKIERVVRGSGDDAFVAISHRGMSPPCGGAFLLHYDGKSFHRF
jgi:hypothetical protein